MHRKVDTHLHTIPNTNDGDINKYLIILENYLYILIWELPLWSVFIIIVIFYHGLLLMEIE